MGTKRKIDLDQTAAMKAMISHEPVGWVPLAGRELATAVRGSDSLVADAGKGGEGRCVASIGHAGAPTALAVD